MVLLLPKTRTHESCSVADIPLIHCIILCHLSVFRSSYFTHLLSTTLTCATDMLIFLLRAEGRRPSLRHMRWTSNVLRTLPPHAVLALYSIIILKWSDRRWQAHEILTWASRTRGADHGVAPVQLLRDPGHKHADPQVSRSRCAYFVCTTHIFYTNILTSMSHFSHTLVTNGQCDFNM